MRHLHGPDLFEWMALRRVRNGQVTQLRSGRWLDGGFRVADYVRDALTSALEAGLVSLVEQPSLCQRVAFLSAAGDVRYQALTS